MELSTVEIPRAGAREAAADYARLAKRTTDPRERQEFEDIARAYRIAARDEVPLIALTPTIQAGGTQIRTRVLHGWRDGQRVVTGRQNYLLPKLAVCTPHSAFCFTLGVQRDGSVEFIDALGRDYRYRKGVIDLETQFDLPEDFTAGEALAGRSWGNTAAWRTMVPIVPPKHRPARGFGQRLVLWEADEWAWTTVPRPPGDPALLRPVGGDIYAVEATWDLTELERLVLSGRRIDA